MLVGVVRCLSIGGKIRSTMCNNGVERNRCRSS